MRSPVQLLARLALLGALCAGGFANAADDGAGAAAREAPAWPQWQGRVTLGAAPDGPGRLGVPASRHAFGSASLLGDFYFARSWVPAGQLGGFRATSGLMVGARSSSLLLGGAATRADGGALAFGRRTLPQGLSLPGSDPSTDGNATVPYLGFGWTGLAVRSGWSYSADLGLAGGPARLGRALGAGQSLDDAIRDLRMAPVAQVGVSYAF